MCGSVLASLIGLAGSGYCFVISAMSLLEGPFCMVNSNWTTPFINDKARYETAIDPSCMNEMLDSVQLLNILPLSLYLLFLDTCLSMNPGLSVNSLLTLLNGM